MVEEGIYLHWRRGIKNEKVKENLNDVGFDGLSLNKLDDFSILVQKFIEGKKCSLNDDKRQKSRQYVAPWHKEYCLKFIRWYELIGIPLQFWSENNIKKIGSALGIVSIIHFKENNYTLVKVCVTVERNSPHHVHTNALFVKDNNRTIECLSKKLVQLYLMKMTNLFVPWSFLILEKIVPRKGGC